MYKTILVYVDETAATAHRIEVAANLARKFESHLVGTAITGLSAYMFPVSGIGAGMPPIVFPIDELRAAAAQVLDRFDQLASSAGLSSFERSMVDDEAGFGISLRARYSDVVVIGQCRSDAFTPGIRSDLAEHVVLNGMRPVLVVPHSSSVVDIGRIVTIGWNGSAEAVRAITSAIPLLKRAQRVDLVVFNAEEDIELHGDDPGADMGLYLARHGIRVKVSATAAGRDDGDAILTFAADTGADLIVMGAYGHSRFQEFLLGGMTRTALASSPVALWMSH